LGDADLDFGVVWHVAPESSCVITFDSDVNILNADGDFTLTQTTDRSEDGVHTVNVWPITPAGVLLDTD
jgi:hypothetical protein